MDARHKLIELLNLCKCDKCQSEKKRLIGKQEEEQKKERDRKGDIKQMT